MGALRIPAMVRLRGYLMLVLCSTRLDLDIHLLLPVIPPMVMTFSTYSLMLDSVMPDTSARYVSSARSK